MSRTSPRCCRFLLPCPGRVSGTNRCGRPASSAYVSGWSARRMRQAPGPGCPAAGLGAGDAVSVARPSGESRRVRVSVERGAAVDGGGVDGVGNTVTGWSGEGARPAPDVGQRSGSESWDRARRTKAWAGVVGRVVGQGPWEEARAGVVGQSCGTGRHGVRAGQASLVLGTGQQTQSGRPAAAGGDRVRTVRPASGAGRGSWRGRLRGRGVLWCRGCGFGVVDRAVLRAPLGRACPGLR